MFKSTENRKNFISFGIILILVTFFAFGSLNAQSGSASGIETVPGQLIIKLASAEGFEGLNKSRTPGQSSIYSSTQTLEAVQAAMSAYNLTDVNQVMSAQSFEELRVDRLQRTVPGQLPTELSDDLV